MLRLIFCVILSMSIGNKFDVIDANVLNWPNVNEITNSPIIGVLAQEIAWPLNKIYPGVYDSYIASSYVKFVEGGGARVVPIWIGRSRPYYEMIMNKVNGVLMPGGGVWFNLTNGYAAAGAHIYDIATKMNDEGKYFPLWGTCLGFELLVYVSNGQQEYRSDCSSQRQVLPLNFTNDFHNSRLYGSAPKHIIDALRDDPVTINFHSYCFTRQALNNFGLDRIWRVMSVNEDFHGVEFISSIEHKRYPFYGAQFHPEKNIYEWIGNRNIPHSASAIVVSQYFAAFFVNECRKSGNRFANVNEENQMLIYNYPATFTGRLNSTFEQSYLFKPRTQYLNDIGENGDINVILV